MHEASGLGWEESVMTGSEMTAMFDGIVFMRRLIRVLYINDYNSDTYTRMDQSSIELSVINTRGKPNTTMAQTHTPGWGPDSGKVIRQIQISF
jgi:hypothetical protein